MSNVTLYLSCPMTNDFDGTFYRWAKEVGDLLTSANFCVVNPAVDNCFSDEARGDPDKELAEMRHMAAQDASDVFFSQGLVLLYSTAIHSWGCAAETGIAYKVGIPIIVVLKEEGMRFSLPRFLEAIATKIVTQGDLVATLRGMPL